MTEPDDNPVPRDATAEAYVLGVCMAWPAGYRTAQTIVTEQDFWKPAHQVIWRHIVACMTREGLADPVIVLDAMRESGERNLADLAPYLHSLYGNAPVALECEHHARIVADLAVRRRLLQAGTRMVQRASSGVGDVGELLEAAAADVRSARDSRAGVDLLTVPVDEFMSTELEEPDWVVPGLLARQDRFVLTGNGGLGKSTLLQQTAVCAAAGLHPFDWPQGEVFDPVRVSIIDCENADYQLKTRLWPLLKNCREMGRPVENRLMIGGHGNPLDLLDASNALSLMRTIERDQPDLVYIGPVYKLHNDDPDKERVVKRVTSVLDQIRATGAALIAEAHPNKGSKLGGSLEPSGSNLWTWWPEFGRGLRLDEDAEKELPGRRRCDLEHWRIDRVQRNWPTSVEHGGRFPWARG